MIDEFDDDSEGSDIIVDDSHSLTIAVWRPLDDDPVVLGDVPTNRGFQKRNHYCQE